MRGKELEAPVFDGPVPDVKKTVMKYFERQRAHIIVDKPDYVYARLCTKMLGFPDDMAVRLVPKGSRKTVVEVQSENVMGRYDFKVNLNRVKEFISFLNFSRK